MSAFDLSHLEQQPPPQQVEPHRVIQYGRFGWGFNRTAAGVVLAIQDAGGTMHAFTLGPLDFPRFLRDAQGAAIHPEANGGG